ncbi:MAG: VOC family protein [Actinomycetota bacterium]|nr:VOC family protein [Actinomycetota bacterium]
MGTIANHVGLCVTDVDASRRFYEEALGFSFQRDLHLPAGSTGSLLQIEEPVVLTAVYLTLGAFVLELLRFDRPDNPPFRPRVFNEPGLTHLSITTDDLPGILDRVRACGGEVLAETDVGLAIMVRDPDGQLIELLPTRR